MSETILLSGKIISKKALNNNKNIKNNTEYFLTIKLNKINIPEIGISNYENNVTILTTFPYICNQETAEYEKVHNIVGKDVAVSCSRFGNIYIASPKDSREKLDIPLSYIEKSVIRNEFNNFLFCSKKYLNINTITCVLIIDSYNSISGVYSCRICSSNLSDIVTRSSGVYFRQVPVIFKSSLIKPKLYKEYIVIGSVVNFPLGYHTSKGRHGIYGEIIKEVSNESQSDKA
jgi:hypothetical protein